MCRSGHFLVNDSFCFSCSPVHLVACVRTIKSTTWIDEHLTEDNQKYLRRSMAEEFRKQTAEKLNPLKDEPWERHQWTEGGRCEGVRGSWVQGLCPLGSPFNSSVPLSRQSKSWRGSREAGDGPNLDKNRRETCRHHVTGIDTQTRLMLLIPCCNFASNYSSRTEICIRDWQLWKCVWSTGQMNWIVLWIVV